MTPEQQEKLDEFTAIREAVGKTTLLSSIFEEPWFKKAWPKIKDSPLPGIRAATPFFHGRPHPLDENDRFNTVLTLLDRRLKAFADLPFKQKEIKDKLNLLRITRSNEDFLNHFFEINVLGDLAVKGVLCDIEESTTKVDGVINLAGRKIFVEATNTVQEVIPRFTETTRVMAVNTDREINQVVEKLHKKTAKNKQLALAKGSPTVLFLARTPYGADRHSAEIAVNECFQANEFAGLSGVVLSDSWKLQITSWHPGFRPDVPLTEVEEKQLRGWYAKK